MFANYFKQLVAAGCEVLEIDGSPGHVFAEHHEVWSDICRHEQVDRRFEFLNDKVNGVHTGVRLASRDKIILADDDIRYTRRDIERICWLLDEFEVVRPQNYFPKAASASSPWSAEPGHVSRVPIAPWALTESARMLINRATLRTADYPGTCGFRRQTFIGAGEYDGDVLFDNEELIRHLARCGAHIAYKNNFFIAKNAPRFRKWLEQRPRQAYEDFGLRWKTVLFGAILPLLFVVAFFRPTWLWLFVIAPILLAIRGWLRGDARKFFPLRICLFAPFWILERSLSTYWAFWCWWWRGGYPFGQRLLAKGIGRDWFEGGRIAAKIASRPDQ